MQRCTGSDWGAVGAAGGTAGQHALHHEVRIGRQQFVHCTAGGRPGCGGTLRHGKKRAPLLVCTGESRAADGWEQQGGGEGGAASCTLLQPSQASSPAIGLTRVS